jgi:hypothetical protein
MSSPNKSGAPNVKMNSPVTLGGSTGKGCCGSAMTAGTTSLTPNKRRVAGDCRDCYWLEVDAMTSPVRVREPEKPFGGSTP